MNLLLDTCALIWFLRNDRELSSTAAEVVEYPGNTVAVSAVSIWEIAIKAQLGKLKAPKGLTSTLEGELVDAGFRILPVTYAHVSGVFALPAVHQDPFDRLLISQCRSEKMIAVTDDPLWSDPRYGIQTLW